MSNNEIRSHRDLIAWQRAYRFGLRIYDVTASFPTHELYGLMSQLRRGAVSVASDIAEGYGRATTRDYLRFLRVARGALYEIDTQLLFASDLGYLDTETHRSLARDLEECERVLAGLTKAIAQSRQHK